MATRPKASYTENDWTTHRMAMSDNTHAIRLNSFDNRQEAHRLRNDIRVKTAWDTYENNLRLADRIEDIELWRQKLIKQIAEVNNELQKLNSTKLAADVALKSQEDILLSVIGECMSLNKERYGIDHTRGDVEHELEKEEMVAENAKRLLRQRIADAFEQRNKLLRCLWQLEQNLNAKTGFKDVETNKLRLTKYSPDISLHPDPYQVPENLITVEDWHNRSNIISGLADGELRSSENLRDVITSSIANSNRMLRDQQARTNFAYRKRIHELEQTLKDLEHQKKMLEDEIKACEDEIARLEAAIENQIPSQKLAQTRLDKQTRRPLTECVADPPWYGLRSECVALDMAQDALVAKLLESK